MLSAFFFFFSDKARDIFGVNPRMEKALERLSENNVTNTTATSKSIPALANALKGIPKSLLEKVIMFIMK